MSYLASGGLPQPFGDTNEPKEDHLEWRPRPVLRGGGATPGAGIENHPPPASRGKLRGFTRGGEFHLHCFRETEVFDLSSQKRFQQKFLNALGDFLDIVCAKVLLQGSVCWATPQQGPCLPGPSSWVADAEGPQGQPQSWASWTQASPAPSSVGTSHHHHHLHTSCLR